MHALFDMAFLRRHRCMCDIFPVMPAAASIGSSADVANAAAAISRTPTKQRGRADNCVGTPADSDARRAVAELAVPAATGIGSSAAVTDGSAATRWRPIAERGHAGGCARGRTAADGDARHLAASGARQGRRCKAEGAVLLLGKTSLSMMSSLSVAASVPLTCHEFALPSCHGFTIAVSLSSACQSC